MTTGRRLTATSYPTPAPVGPAGPPPVIPTPDPAAVETPINPVLPSGSSRLATQELVPAPAQSLPVAVPSSRRPLTIGVIALAVLLVLPVSDAVLPAHWAFSSTMSQVFIYGILALGLQVVTGYTGLLNLGVAAFMAIGTYTYAILTVPFYPFQWNPWLALLAAVVAGAMSGVVLGLPTMRLRGDYLAIVTLGFGEMIQDGLKNLDAVTKGPIGLNPIPRPSLPGLSGVTGHLPIYYMTLGFLVLAAIAVWRLRRARVGRRWLAVREDELATRAMGISPAPVKLGAIAAGAALCALGGGLYAALHGTTDPNGFDYQFSVMILAAVIVGGLGSIGGALLGSLMMFGFTLVILPRVPEILHSMGMEGAATIANPTNWKYAIFGLALVLMMRLRPQGLWPERPGEA